MKRILLIDDDEFTRDMIGSALRQLGYAVETASSGSEGLALARRHLPDLILSDINMPEIDGCTLLSALRSDPELTTKQIVLMTGNRADSLQRTSMNLGADDFLHKPFTIEELESCLVARLKRAEISRRVEDKAIQTLQATLRSTLPHEFFTPLAGILGLVELLQTDMVRLPPAEVQEILRDIRQSGLRLHRTLRNYLTMVELQRGADQGAPGPTPLEPTRVREAIQSGVAAASQRHDRTADIVLELEDCVVAGHPPDIAMILEELVENACTYSRKGTPVRVSLTSQGSCTVRDHGRGMTPYQIGAIAAFRQFDRKKYEQQGLGLGLTLVHQLAERQGGRFSIQSEPGNGTSAVVDFRVG